MLLRSLRVEGWRCFANPVQIGPLAEGINVLHGPNGTGKSTLLGALARGLFDNHNVGGKEVETLRPWGRALNPTVTIEFDHDEQPYRLAKRFLGSAMVELSRLEDDRFTRLAEGEAADRMTREMLAAAAPNRGLSKRQHWGWAQVLWAPQDGLALADISPDLAGAIRASLGVQISDAASDAFEQKVAAAYEAIFTKSGRLKSGKDAPPAVAWEQQLDEARQQRRERASHVAEFDQMSRQVQDLQSRKEQALRDEEQFDRELDEARKQARTYRDLLADRDRQREAASAAEANYRDLKRRADAITAERDQLAQTKAALERLETDAPLLAKEEATRRREAEQARLEIERTRTRRREIESRRRLAQTAETFLRTRQQLAQTDARLEKLAAVGNEVEQLRSRRNRLVAPNGSELEAIRDAKAAWEHAQVQLQAALITVTVSAEADLALEVLRAERPGEHKIGEGESCRLQGSPEVAFRLPGVGTVRATGPTGSVEQQRARAEEAQQHFAAWCEGFGTRELDRLQQLHQEAATLEKELGQAEVRLETLLEGRTLEQWEQDRARLAQSVEATLAEQPDWDDAPPDAEALAAEAQRAERNFMHDIDEAEARSDQANQAHDAAKERHDAHQLKIEGLREQIAQAEKRLAKLVDDDRDESERQTTLEGFAMKWNAAKAAVEVAEKKLGPFVEDPRLAVETLDRQLDRVRREAARAREELSHAEGQLQKLAAAAPYSALSEVEETIARLETDLACEYLHYNAVRLLHETLTHCRAEAVEAVLGPVEKRATRTLERIAGVGLGKVCFGESFLPSDVAPGHLDEPVALERLSGGEQEQLHLAVRLALAEVLFPDGRQLVVLDDVLTATDTARLARIMRILEETATRLQILILTCHPERYGGLKDAAFFDLNQLRAEA